MKNKENIMVKEWLEIWLKQQKKFVKDSTYATYSNAIYNHIVPYFDDMWLKDITTQINQEFILHLSQYGRMDNTGGLSAKTTKDIFTLWLAIINDASQKNYIKIMPQKYKFPVSENKQRVKCLTKEQEKQMINMLTKDMTLRNVGILLALFTGIRIGEICALRWEEINIKERTITIKRTLQRIYLKDNNLASSQIVISTPKTKKSIRTIPISKKMADILKVFQNDDKSYFLTGEEGKYIEPRAYREYYNRLMNRNHMHFVSFHGLRHTFATRCIDAGCDYKTISEILGHADVGTTMQLYVHSNLDKKRECIEKMELFWAEI